jgi:TetR/AcrR family transcriptional regulator, fatty acid biosynthesis regulator
MTSGLFAGHFADRLIGGVNRSGVGGVGRTLSRGEAKELTRQRLLNAALAILDEKGEGGLTASAVARAAGIAQSSFYVHFRDRDDLLAALGDEAVLRMRRLLREARRRSWEEPDDLERLKATFRIPIERTVAHPEIFRIGLRARHDRASPLGDATREVLAGYRKDLSEDLAVLGFPSETPAERRRLEMVADGYIALTECLIIGHLEGRYPNVEEMVDVLVTFTLGPRTLLPGSAPFSVEGDP